MHKKKILLYSFFHISEAAIFAGMLFNNGIESEIRDENINSIYPLANLAMGGIKLFVNEADYPQAFSILEEYLSVSPEKESELPYKIMCPSCGSFHTLKIPTEKMQFFDEFRCFECDYEWDNRDEKNINPGIWE